MNARTKNGKTRSGGRDRRRLSETFGALADETRRGILERLALGETTVGELAEPFNMSRPAVSKHLRVLEDAGLIVRTRDGRVNRCRLTAMPMRQAADWVDSYRRFWEAQLDSLAFFFDQRAADTPAAEADRAPSGQTPEAGPAVNDDGKKTESS